MLHIVRQCCWSVFSHKAKHHNEIKTLVLKYQTNNPNNWHCFTANLDKHRTSLLDSSFVSRRSRLWNFLSMNAFLYSPNIPKRPLASLHTHTRFDSIQIQPWQYCSIKKNVYFYSFHMTFFLLRMSSSCIIVLCLVVSYPTLLQVPSFKNGIYFFSSFSRLISQNKIKSLYKFFLIYLPMTKFSNCA